MTAEKRNDDDPVTDELCKARRETITERIDGLKKCVYASSCAVALVVTVVQLLLRFTQ